jgi:hypothetical protein
MTDHKHLTQCLKPAMLPKSILAVCLFLIACGTVRPPEDSLDEKYRRFTASYRVKYEAAEATQRCTSEKWQIVHDATRVGDIALADRAVKALPNELAKCPGIIGARPNETMIDYIDRLRDEFDESNCLYQAAFRLRDRGGSYNVYEDYKAQCLRDLELRKIRRELEKAIKAR